MATTVTDSWHGRQLNADLSALPHTLDVTPSRVVPVLHTICGAILIVGVLLASDVIAGLGPAGVAGFWISLLIGVCQLIRGLLTLTLRRTATFRVDGVEVVGRRLLRPESWNLPYTAYKGVQHREEVVKSEESMTTYQIIELAHEDPGKCIPLHVEPTGEVPRARWEAYARRLGLPALERDQSEPSGMAARHHGDLDKPLRELVEDGRLGHAFDRDSAPPAGLRVTPDGPNSLILTILAPRVPMRFLGLLIFGGWAVPAVALLIDIFPVIFLVAGLIVSVIAGHIFYRDRTSNRQLRLDRRSLTLNDNLMSSSRFHKALSFDQIESIVIGRESGSIGDELVIAGDKGRMRIGVGLSPEALTWLKNYLTAAIATA